ncbi:hypothetical protein CRYUN_Cryun31cG0126200 [Craigia yunnanensis]
MGSECSPSKRHYDITMSRRTRKPMKLQDINPLKEELESDRKSLNQLINGDENAKAELSRSGSRRSSSTTSLSHHFTEEEKQLQLVKKNHQQDNNGVKLKGMMKVLSHLMKMKPVPQPLGSRKKHPLQLTM